MKKLLLLQFTFSLFFNYAGYSQTAALKANLTLESINGITIPYQNNFPLPGFEKQKRTTISLHGLWKKQRFHADHNLTLADRNSSYNSLIAEAAWRHTAGYDDSNWEQIYIPSVENNMYEFPTVPEYYQDGIFYRYKFDVSSGLTGEFAKLIFYSVNYVADVWLNEHYLGYHEGGYTPFAFDVSDKLNYGGSNLIVVRVDNIPWGSRKDIVPFYQCDWFNYAGIIHDVYLEFSNEASVVRCDVVPQNLEGDFETTTVLNNISNEQKNVTLEFQVYSAEWNEITIQSEFPHDILGDQININAQTEYYLSLEPNNASAIKIPLKIDNPKLWSHVKPNLYIIKTVLREGETIIDEYHSQFGIRNVNAEGNKIKLNGSVIFLTGAARHEDHPVYGRALPKSIIYSDLSLIKNSKINFLRTAHYPNHPYTYIIADRLGINIMEEIPVWWFDNETEWLIQNNDRNIHKQMFREMVFKDYNRPSIIVWSASNECKEETNRLIYNQMIVDDIKTNYYDGRLISQSSAGDNPGHSDITQAPLDAAGWTLYFGVFHGSTYFAGTAAFLSRAKSAFPDKPIIATEFGYWSSENSSSEDVQVTVFNETFNAFKYYSAINASGSLNDFGCLAAVTWWCVFDWYSHQHKNGFQSMGLISMNRQHKKPVYDALVSGYSPYYDFGGMVTDAEASNDNQMPAEFGLYQNYPNPFNPGTQIKYTLPDESKIKLELFDSLGQSISVLAEETKSPGAYEKSIDMKGFSSGIYICRMTAYSLNGKNLFEKSIKLLLIK